MVFTYSTSIINYRQKTQGIFFRRTFLEKRPVFNGIWNSGTTEPGIFFTPHDGSRGVDDMEELPSDAIESNSPRLC